MIKQSKRWIPKKQPIYSPTKARVHASRTKQIVLAFFNNKVLIYTNILPMGSTVNILGDLSTFMRHFNKKRPELVGRVWSFQWDNDPACTLPTSSRTSSPPEPSC